MTPSPVRQLLVVGLFACLLLGMIRDAAAAPVDELLQRLAPIDQLQGTFSQQQYSAAGDVLLQSGGSFRLLRPGYFAWEITAPDSQLVIAGPEFIWHHDRDLETVTRRPAAGDQMAPLQVLGGDAEVLRRRFNVTSDGADSYTLTPREGDPGFRSLTLGFASGQVQSMDIVDRLNQRILVRFSALSTSPALSPADFAFSPPEGVDLFYYDE